MGRMTRRDALKTGLAGAGALVAANHLVGETNGNWFSFHYDHVIGTSLDVWLATADSGLAQSAEGLILDEIERLRRVFSTYDPTSELSRLNAADGPVPASSDLLAVLGHDLRRF